MYNRYRSSPPPDWNDIATAPRDGTPVEIQNNWGVAAHYGVCKWVEGRGWVYVNDQNRSMSDGSHLSWRPYDGDVTSYTDPTGGLQDDPRYWRQAAARSAGLPENYFEAEATRNAVKSATIEKPRKRFLGIF